MTSFAAMPGIEVLPMWSTRDTTSGPARMTRSRSRSARAGQSGRYSTTSMLITQTLRSARRTAGGRGGPMFVERDGVELVYETCGSGDPPIVFVHGWACDRSYFAPQIAYFE